MTQPLRFSHLRTLGQRSPAHLKAELDGGEKGDTTAMLIGSALDASIFGTMPVIVYSGRRAGHAWEDFATSNCDYLIVSETEFEKVDGMVKSLKNHPGAMKWLEGVRQEAILWNCAGIACRSTPDVYTPGAGRLVDLKTSFTTQPDRLQAHCLKMAYHAQLSFYAEALRITGKANPSQVAIVAVESTPPHPVTILRLSDRTLEAGEKLWRSWFERYRVCAETNLWPGYSQAVVEMDVDEHVELTYGDEEAA